VSPTSDKKITSIKTDTDVGFALDRGQEFLGKIVAIIQTNTVCSSKMLIGSIIVLNEDAQLLL